MRRDVRSFDHDVQEAMRILFHAARESCDWCGGAASCARARSASSNRRGVQELESGHQFMIGRQGVAMQAWRSSLRERLDHDLAVDLPSCQRASVWKRCDAQGTILGAQCIALACREGVLERRRASTRSRRLRALPAAIATSMPLPIGVSFSPGRARKISCSRRQAVTTSRRENCNAAAIHRTGVQFPGAVAELLRLREFHAVTRARQIHVARSVQPVAPHHQNLSPLESIAADGWQHSQMVPSGES